MDAPQSTVTLLLTGDLCLAGSVAGYIKEHGPEKAEEQWKPFIGSYDGMVCNLEVPLLENAALPGGPSIWALQETASVLRAWNVLAVGLANNHTLDFGERGLKATLDKLKADGVAHSGTGWTREQAYRPAVFTAGRYRFGLVSFAFKCERKVPWGKAKLAGDNQNKMKSLIRELKKSVDFVIVSWHNGIEYSHAPMLPARRRCRELIDAGADIILGHHPHVAQGMEYYKHGVILYSLGNFMFDRRFVQPHSSGLLVRAVISKDGISCEPFFLTGDFQTGMPVIANRETTMEKLKCLNANIGSRKLWKADCRTFWAQYLKEVHRDWKNPYRLFHNTCAYARARHHWRILLGTLGI